LEIKSKFPFLKLASEEKLLVNHKIGHIPPIFAFDFPAFCRHTVAQIDAYKRKLLLNNSGNRMPS